MSAAAAAVAPALAQAPMLLPYQTAWVRDKARVKIIEKSRRIGMSWCEAYDDVMYAGEGKGNVYYQCPAQDMTRTYIDDCAKWAEDIQIGMGPAREMLIDLEDGRAIQAFRIALASGKAITAMTSNPRGFRGKGRPGDVAVIDEAAFCDDLGEVLKAALAFTIWGGQVRILSTHNGAENPFNELLEDVRKGRLPYSLRKVTLDDAIADGLARRIFEVTGRRWHAGAAAEWRAETIAQYGKSEHDENVREELFCEPKRSGAAYFTRALVESRMADRPVVEFRGTAEFEAMTEPARRAETAAWLDRELGPLLAALPKDRRHVCGMDFARASHLSVFAPLTIGADLRREAPFVIEIKGCPYAQQQQIVEYCCERLPRFSGGCFDATGNGGALAEGMEDIYGSMIEKVMFSEQWYRDWMPRYKAAFEDQMITLPRSDAIVEDHRAVKLVNGVPKLPKAATGPGRHGDSAIGLALAWQASTRDAGPVEATIHEQADAANPMDYSHLDGFTDGFNDDMRGFL